MSDAAPNAQDAGQAAPAEPESALEAPSSDDLIRTLPPLDESPSGVPISDQTGQPRRGKVMVLAMAFLYAAALVSAAALGKAWWDTLHVGNWPNSIRLIRIAHVSPSQWQTVLLVLAMGFAGAAMTASCAIAGFNAWNGYRWSRIAAIVAVVITGLAWFLNPLAWVALPLAAIGAGVLWTPPVTRYFGHWEAFRAGQAQHPIEWGRVYYGPLPRYR